MSNTDLIEHPGTVVNIEENKISVQILSVSACSTCHAKGFCNASDMENKVIEIAGSNKQNFKTGDQVTVFMQQSQGNRAVILGYLIPFLILIISLLTLASITGNELISGLIAIGLLVPYYSGLYLLRNRIQKKFEFRIRKINN